MRTAAIPDNGRGKGAEPLSTTFGTIAGGKEDECRHWFAETDPTTVGTKRWGEPSIGSQKRTGDLELAYRAPNERGEAVWGGAKMG